MIFFAYDRQLDATSSNSRAGIRNFSLEVQTTTNIYE